MAACYLHLKEPGKVFLLLCVLFLQGPSLTFSLGREGIFDNGLESGAVLSEGCVWGGGVFLVLNIEGLSYRKPKRTGPLLYTCR